MSVFQTALSSARFNRFLMWGSGIILFVGVAVLLMTLVKGNDTTQVNPDKGFHPTLPKKSTPLQNSQGVTITKYQELDPEVRSTIKTFLATAVARRHLDKSWAVIGPTMRKGYTFKSWTHPGQEGLPVIPYPIADVNTTTVLPRLRVDGRDPARGRRLGPREGEAAPDVVPARHVACRGRPEQKKVWRVDYWMPRWTPPLPTN